MMYRPGKFKYQEWGPLLKGVKMQAGDVVCGPRTDPQCIFAEQRMSHWAFIHKKAAGFIIHRLGVGDNVKLCDDLFRRPYSVYRARGLVFNNPPKPKQNRFAHKFRLNPFHSEPLPLP